MYKVILFDLDGTLTESGEGITKSVQYALERIGKPEPDLEKLKVFIGPPLMEMFMQYAQIDEATAKQAVEIYRERYSVTGIFENAVYPGIENMLAQLEKNYGREGAEILTDNCQDTIFGGFAPNSQTAEQLSKSLGSRTVLSGSVSRGKNDPSQSLQMMERPLLTADELKSIPKGSFIVQKTGCHPMRTRLRLFLEWGITFEEEYRVEEQAARKVYYADQNALTRAIVRKYPPKLTEQKTTRSIKGEGQLHDAPAQEMVVAEDIDYDRMPHKRAPYNLPRQEVDR